MAEKNNDLQRIKELIEVMKDNDLLEVEIKHGDDQIHLKRLSPQQPAFGAVPMINPNLSAEPPGSGINEGSEAQAGRPADLVEIKSPMVGTFFATPSPDSDPYVEINSHVEPQTVVCIIEAMKVMNEIKAEVSGTVVEVLLTNGQAVEYGQVLFRLKPD